MVRLELTSGSTRVEYGFEDFTGIVLVVRDTRLAVVANGSDDKALDSVACAVCESGDGAYVALHTGQVGRGLRVAPCVMAEYLRRFGVPEGHIRQLIRRSLVGCCRGCSRTIAPCHVCDSVLDSAEPFVAVDPTLNTACTACATATGDLRRCSSCKSVSYCFKACQRADWPIHRLFCKLDVPPPLQGERSVCGLLFPVNKTSPVLVQVPFQLFEDNYIPCVTSFEDGQFDAVGMYDRYGNNRLGYVLTLYYRDTFRIDGSPVNPCVREMSQGHTAMRGPLLMVKSEGVEENFMDITKADATTIAKFLAVVFYH